MKIFKEIKSVEKFFHGVDACIETSLFEYGLAWKEESKDSYLFYYGIKYGDQGDYVTFDHCQLTKPESIFIEFDWVNWESFLNTLGLTKSEFLMRDFPFQISDLLGYYGYENIFGSSYWEGFSFLNESTLEALLPNGSGIGYYWEFITHKNGKITCKNDFHAMNNNGYYDGYMPFKFTVFIDKDNNLDFSRIVCNDNKRASFYGLKEYLGDTIFQSLRSQ